MDSLKTSSAFARKSAKNRDRLLCPKATAITREITDHRGAARTELSGVHPKTETGKLGTLFIKWEGVSLSKTNREFSTEFRVQVAQRILQGESVSKLRDELDIKRSMLYRWRDAYRKEGAAGLSHKVGRPPGIANPARKPGVSEAEALRQQIAALERKIGQQTLQLDFFKRAFQRVKDSSQASGSAGETASTRRSGR
jgi:transposase